MILSNGNSKQIIAVSGLQIKSISIDFCELYSDSCEKCLKSSINQYYSSQCYWSNNVCQSKFKLDFNRYLNHSVVNNLAKCSIPTIANTTKEFLTNITTRSSLNLKNVTSFLRNQPTKSSSITFFEANFLYNLSKLTALEKQSQAKPQTISSENKNLWQSNFESSASFSIYIIISIIGSIIGLFTGLLFGFIIKANYSKKLLNIISTKFSSSRQTQKSIKNKPESTNSELELAVEDIIVRERGRAANISISKNKTNLECISRSSNSDESFGSTKSTSCCNENCVHNRSASDNSERVSDVALNPPLNCTYTKEKEYFILQNDYDNYSSKVQAKNSTEPLKKASNNRFSSLSSSTDSSSYGLYNVAHHQNNYKAQVTGASQFCLLPPQINKMPPTPSNKQTISLIETDCGKIYGKATFMAKHPPPLFRQQQPSHCLTYGKLIKDHRITTKTQFTRPKLKVNRKKNLEKKKLHPNSDL